MTDASETNAEPSEGSVELTARVLAEGNRFVAVIDRLGLEGRGVTTDDARQSLVQTVRGWLERQDTSGKLGVALGIDELDDETEIVLLFADERSEYPD